MENIGLNSDIRAGGKSFHIQTQYLEPTEKIISNIFEDGKVITSKSVDVKGGTSVQDLKLKVNRLHRDMSSYLELLFYISEKVRTIRHAPSNNKLGLVFLKKNLFDEAIKEFKFALEIDPDYVEVYKNLGLTYLKKNNVKEAKEAFGQGIAKNASYADLHNHLGYTHFLLNEQNEAIQALNRALEINPDYVDAMINLSMVYLKIIISEAPQAAPYSKVELLNKVKELLIVVSEQNEQFKSQTFQTVSALIEQNNYVEALKVLEAAVVERQFSTDIDLENEFYLNFMFGGKGKDREFIDTYTEELKKAIEKYPEYADLHNNLGIAYLIHCRNLFLNALEEFRSALQINPNYKKAEKNLKLAENDGKGFLILLRAILK